MTPEVPLLGGRQQRVVRIGDTVRRAPQLNARFVRKLLSDLHQSGFVAVPRWLGLDEKGRDILSYMEGAVPLELGHFEDEMICKAAIFIRSYHDATTEFFGSGRIACHNDLSPCNFVFENGNPVGIIDFDLAAEGERLFDLGFAAWTWLDVGNEDDYSVAEQVRRLRLFAQAYGSNINVEELIDAILTRQRLLAGGFGAADDGACDWAQSCYQSTLRLREVMGDLPRS